MNLRNKLKAYTLNGFETLKSYPIEITIGLFFFIYWLYIRIRGEQEVPDELYFLFPILEVLIVSFNRLTRKKHSRIYYYASFLMGIPLYYYHFTFFSPQYLAVCIIAFILFASDRWAKDNKTYSLSASNGFIALLLGNVLSSVTWAISLSIYHSVVLLFNIDVRVSHSFVNELLGAFAYFVTLPFFVTYMLQKRTINSEETNQTILSILVNYILIPALAIYTVIFYSYIVKIVVAWELPHGNIANMVFGYMIGLLITNLLSIQLADDKKNRIIHKALFLTLPLLALFWIGVYYRIHEYGFTERRIYLVIYGVIMTAYPLLFMVRKTGHYRNLSAFAIVLTSVFTLLPGISAHDLKPKSVEAVQKLDYWQESIYLNAPDSFSLMQMEEYKELGRFINSTTELNIGSYDKPQIITFDFIGHFEQKLRTQGFDFSKPIETKDFSIKDPAFYRVEISPDSIIMVNSLNLQFSNQHYIVNSIDVKCLLTR
ncbi:MAG: DUF4153 domain-containing protein [Tannerellaceae bacterium]